MISKKQKQNKIAKVMKKWQSGKLKTSNGKIVTNIKQAKAIALSEAGIKKLKKKLKGK